MRPHTLCGKHTRYIPKGKIQCLGTQRPQFRGRPRLFMPCLIQPMFESRRRQRIGGCRSSTDACVNTTSILPLPLPLIEEYATEESQVRISCSHASTLLIFLLASSERASPILSASEFAKGYGRGDRGRLGYCGAKADS